MDIQWAPFVQAVVSSIVYSTVGIVMFALSFLLINALTPFSIRKEIEEDQNSALAIVIAAVIIGLGLVISAAIHG
jgi:putative membrane protein